MKSKYLVSLYRSFIIFFLLIPTFFFKNFSEIMNNSVVEWYPTSRLLLLGIIWNKSVFEILFSWKKIGLPRHDTAFHLHFALHRYSRPRVIFFSPGTLRRGLGGLTFSPSSWETRNNAPRVNSRYSNRAHACVLYLYNTCVLYTLVFEWRAAASVRYAYR